MNFSAIVAMISAAGQLLPILIQAMQAVEAAIPQAGAGQTKLAMVQAWMAKAFEALNMTNTTFTSVWPILQETAATLVAWYNATGVFKKAPPSA